MAETTVWLLVATAASAGALHTAIGIDHTLPFVVLARAQNWSLRKLWVVTTLCGLGHVLSSVLLGLVGIGFGIGIQQLNWFDSSRSVVASWLLIGFGLAYATWGFYRYLRHRHHEHSHAHAGGTFHTHDHEHDSNHLHTHGTAGGPVTAWVLFLILVFGPCEPLIPILMASALDGPWTVAAAVTLCFALATIGTMLVLVTLGFLGLGAPRLTSLAPHAETLAGLALVVTGVAIRGLGL